VTDAQAIKLWPAKNNNLVNKITGKAYKAAGVLAAKVAAGGNQEQMPWLRTSLNVMKDWAVQRMIKACRLDY